MTIKIARKRRFPLTESWLWFLWWQYIIKAMTRYSTDPKHIRWIHNSFSAKLITYWKRKQTIKPNEIQNPSSTPRYMQQETRCMQVIESISYHEPAQFSHRQTHLQLGSKYTFHRNKYDQLPPYQSGPYFFSRWTLDQLLSCQELTHHHSPSPETRINGVLALLQHLSPVQTPWAMNSSRGATQSKPKTLTNLFQIQVMKEQCKLCQKIQPLFWSWSGTPMNR